MLEGSACIGELLNIKESGFNPKANSLSLWQAFISPEKNDKNTDYWTLLFDILIQ